MAGVRFVRGTARGIKTGAIILALNGKVVSGPDDLSVHISEMAPGSMVHLKITCDSQTRDVAATLSKLAEKPEESGRGTASSSALRGLQALSPSRRGTFVESRKNGTVLGRRNRIMRILLAIDDSKFSESATEAVIGLANGFANATRKVPRWHQHHTSSIYLFSGEL